MTKKRIPLKYFIPIYGLWSWAQEDDLTENQSIIVYIYQISPLLAALITGLILLIINLTI